MRIVILGAGGMLGQKLAHRLAQGALGPVDQILVDLSSPAEVPGARSLSLDLTQPGAAQAVADMAPDMVVHLAAVVSGQAEADFDLGYKVNYDLTRDLAQALRALPCQPRLIFSSSLAVYGPPFCTPVAEDFRPNPASSYGTQKALAELLLADYTRKGFLRATSLRLPTVSIRPGAPNAAASGFLSGILREPIHGVAADLPVSSQAAFWLASPDVTVAGILHAMGLDWDQIRDPNPLNLRGIRVTIGQMLDGLEAAMGPEARALVRPVPNDTIARIVTSWPDLFVTERAQRLGFPVNTGIDQIIAEYRSQYA